MANDEPTIEQQDSQTALDILKKRIDDLELSIGVLNPRNMAGLRTKDLQQATRANLFGDGSDGDVVVSTEITLTRDMFYNNLTVESTGIINTASYRIFVTDQFNKKAGGIIRNNGNTGGNGHNGDGSADGGAAGTGAIAVASGSLPGTVAGSDGGRGAYPSAVGVDGISVAKSLGSAGSGGGGGGAGSVTGGAAGGNGGSQTGTVFNIPKSFTSAYYLFDYFPSVATFTLSAGGGGGGGGGNDNTTDRWGGGGGGSGSPGGMIWIAANRMFIEGDGEIQAKGGTGGNGGNGDIIRGGGGGGGAGGSGGVIMLIYGEKTGTGTLSVAGGAGGTGGTGVNSGANGSTGQTGKIYLIQIQ